MIRRLRFRFIGVSTLALFLAMVITTGAVIGLAVLRIDRQYDAVLEALLGNRGVIPRNMQDTDGRISLAEMPELMNEIRYFAVWTAPDGTVESEDLEHVSTMSSDSVRGAVAAAERKNRNNGSVRIAGSYYTFGRQAYPGRTLYVFIDITSRFWMLREVLIYMVLVGLCVVLVYVFVFTYYSKKIIQPQVDAMERQQRFITNASHELKTPLAVISANTEMTEMLHGSDKWTQSTMRQVERMSGLTQRLVTLCRMEENSPEDMQDVDLSALVAEEAGNYEQVIVRAGKAFRSRVAQGVIVRGDEKSLRELCSILLDNAAKYCDDGGLVELTLTGGRHPVLTVRNSYADAGRVQTSRFFERFYREDGSRNSQKKGYGIGLNIAGDIVTRMGGHISADARNRSIRFCITMRAGQKKSESAS